MENAATMDAYKNSGYYQSLGIEGLQEQLAGYQTDEGALREQAENQYKPVYDAELQAIRQQLALQTQGYTGQLAGMGVAYDQQRRKTNQAYNESAVNLNNQLTKRGLGRSSLVSTQGAYLENQRNLALGDINASETAAINSINEKIALLTDQAAQKEQTLAENYARQLENRVGELREKNQSASLSLQLQIAALQQQGYEAYQDWLLDQRRQELDEQEFKVKYPEPVETESGGSAGGSVSSKKTATAKKTETGAAGGVLKSILDPVRQALTLKKSSAAQKAAIKTVAKTGAKTGKKRLGAR